MATWGWLDDDVGRLDIDRVDSLIGRRSLVNAVHGKTQAVQFLVMLSWECGCADRTPGRLDSHQQFVLREGGLEREPGYKRLQRRQ